MNRLPACLLSLVLAGIPALAAATPPSTPGSLYLRARAAETIGTPDDVSARFRALLSQTGGVDQTVVERAYRVAISIGDMPLALKAAHLLVGRHPAVPDAQVLLALEPLGRRDWMAARSAVMELGRDNAFAFLVPYFRAWIVVGAGQPGALAALEDARGLPQAAAYRAEQRALLLIALGRRAEAVGSLGPQAAAQLPAGIPDARHGIALLLLRVSADLAQQNVRPAGIFMARFAAYAAPDDGTAWFLLAAQLQRLRRPDLALAALDHITAGDPLSRAATDVRLGLLADAGKHSQALAAAMAATKRTDAGSADWMRIGELHMLEQQPAAAVDAFSRALTLAAAAHAPAETLVPILLQQGAALDLSGDWPAAKAVLLRAFALLPHDPLVLNQVGYTLIERREDLDRATAMIAEASRTRPDDPAITDSFGWALYLQGEPDQAVPLLERAVAGEAGEAAINEHLGDAYWATGRRFEARYAWRAALLTADEKDRARLTGKLDLGPEPTAGKP